MLLVTDSGFYFTVVEDFDDPSVLWARSQDLASIQDAADFLASAYEEAFPIRDEPTWDYQFRIQVGRQEWSAYLEHCAHEISANKLKPAVAKARGADHPIARMVEEVFYFMSYNRPDGSNPGWVSGKAKAPATFKRFG